MAKVNQKVMSMVEEELSKKPDLSTDELFEKAKAVDKNMAKLTKRQFNARYPLQVKRRRAPARKRSKGRRRAGGRRPAAGDARRAAVRDTLMRFAMDISSAEGKSDVVGVIAGLDRYVDDIFKAAAK
jgi:hypothetical protein